MIEAFGLQWGTMFQLLTTVFRFVNPTVGALTPTSGVYTVLAFRS